MFIKLKIPTVTIPGCAKGNMIVQKVLMGEYPSIAAASSYVFDRFAKKVIKKIVVKGTAIQL